MKNKSESKKLLKVLIDLMWYGGLSASIILILVTILFNLSVIGIVKMNMPVISIKMDNHLYKLNSQFAEVKRIDSIINESVEREVATAMFWSIPQDKDAIGQLYKIDFSKMPEEYMHSEVFRGGRYLLYDPIHLFPIRYVTHRLIPELVLGLSFFSFIISLFLIIILYNLRELFKSSAMGNAFSQGNSVRLKFIGFYFLLGEIVRVLIFSWINNSVARTEWVDNVRLSYTFSLSDINFALLFAGIIFLILAQTFRMGAVLKQENDLTV